MKIFQNQVNTIKNTIDKLISKAEASEGEITGSVQDIPPTSPIDEIVVHPPESEEIGLSYVEEQAEALSALPPKPPSLLKKAPTGSPLSKEPSFEESITESEPAPEIEDVDISIQEPKEPEVPVVEEENLDTDELKAELEGLESKINSVNNLLGFIEKKHESGKLDKKSYEKQRKKLEKDLNNSNKKIDEIKKLLGE